MKTSRLVGFIIDFCNVTVCGINKSIGSKYLDSIILLDSFTCFTYFVLHK